MRINTHTQRKRQQNINISDTQTRTIDTIIHASKMALRKLFGNVFLKVSTKDFDSGEFLLR